MKTPIITTLAAAATLGLAAFAEAQVGPSPSAFAAPADRTGAAGSCALSIQGDALVASAAPRNARDWSLTVRAPGLSVDQGGDLSGESRRMERLSRVVAVDTRPERGRFHARIGPETPNLMRPLRADLVVRGRNGAEICRDSVRLNAAPRPVRPGRPF